MNFRKLVTAISIIFLLIATIVVIFPLGTNMFLSQTLSFMFPAFLVVVILIINYKISGPLYRWLLIAAVLVLGIISIFESTARVTSIISLVAFIPMFFVDLKRKPS